ncbi:MAG: arylsulfatase [Akkermansiaceae bacterium]
MRSFLTSLFLSLLTCASQADRPNIVLIMADDLGFADLGCYGSEIPTPNLDALAKDGLRFTQFYNTAKCHSSRVSLLTGLYCDQAGSEKLSRGATIAEALAPAGYHTMMVGKWHLSKHPTDFGFHRYWGHLSGATNFFTGDNTFRLDGKEWKVPQTLNGKPFYTTTAITDYALEFLSDRESNSPEKPFLLYCAYNAPHYPLHAPEEDVKRHDGKYAEGWDVLRKRRHAKQIETGLLPAKWELSPRAAHIPAWDSLSAEDKQWEEDRMEAYAAMVDVLDREIGRIIAYLKEKKLYDNTLILFCSDNGACPFDRTRGKNLKPWDPKSYWCYDVGWASVGNTPFRLYKQNQHEGGITSPMIAHLPKSMKLGGKETPLGKITNQPAHLVDFMATFLEIAGATYPENIGGEKKLVRGAGKIKGPALFRDEGGRTMDPLVGKSLVPVFKGEKRQPHDPLYFHFGTDRALRSGDWKLASAKLGKWELYNLADDRTELNDLAEKHPDKVREMAAQWFKIAKDQERLAERHLKPVREGLTPQKFGVRKDPGAKTKK